MKGKNSVPLDRGHHAIRIETPYPLLLSANDEPVRACPAGSNKFVLRLDDPIDLSIDPTEPKAPYSFNVKSKERPYGEELDNLPPPPPPPQDNYLQQLRYKVRQQMGITREAFAERESPYEIGELPPLFEEEEEANRKKLAEIRKKKAEAKKQLQDESATDKTEEQRETSEKKDERTSDTGTVEPTEPPKGGN